MQITQQYYQDLTFEEWMENLRGIYGNKNANRTLSEMWLRVVSDASKVGEAVRKMEPFDAMDSLARTFAWIITTADKMRETEYSGHPALENYDGTPHTTLTGVVLTKYPSLCPYCRANPCVCASIRRTVEKETKMERRRRLRKILDDRRVVSHNSHTISDISQMFDDIYGEVHYGVHIEAITYHFFEEIGEVAQCITNLENGIITNDDSVPITVQLFEEMADTVGWGIAVMSKFGELSRQSSEIVRALCARSGNKILEEDCFFNIERHTMLSRWLWHTFYNPDKRQFTCHKCKEPVCRCPYERS